MINKLTGEPVSAEMQNVLKRLANSENVPEAEIQQLKEIREAAGDFCPVRSGIFRNITSCSNPDAGTELHNEQLSERP